MAPDNEATNGGAMIRTRVVHGLYGGVLGGLVFALIMFVNGTLTDMGMLTLPLIGRLVGQESAIVGFVVHMANSVLIGVVYALLLGWLGRGLVYGLHVGLIYGAVWWFIGPLTLMPRLLGVTVGSLWSTSGALQMFPSLIGHLVYGALLGMTVGGLGPHTSLPVSRLVAGAVTDEDDEDDPEPLERGDLEVDSTSKAGHVPLWMTTGLIAVVFLLNVVIFGYALITGLPHASAKHAAPAAAHDTAGAGGGGAPSAASGTADHGGDTRDDG